MGSRLTNLLPGLVAALVVGGCTLPEVPLSTPKPLDVNINVKLDVYQYTAQGQKPGDAAAEAAVVSNAQEISPERRQAAEKGIRDRMEQIQTLKNNRLVGENREGLLELRETPPGEYGQYAEKTVLQENTDRDTLMRALAREEDKSLPALRREQAILRQKQAFKGEWIEQQEPDDSWRWVQKAESPK